MSPQFAHPQYLFLSALAIPALLFHWYLIGKAVAALAPFIDSRSRELGHDRRRAFSRSLRVRAATRYFQRVSVDSKILSALLATKPG